MAKRMGDEDYYRVLVEVEYDIRYHSYNKNWDHTKPTTGDHEGDNPMYVWHKDITHEEHCYYLGPYTSLKALEREYDRWSKHYLDSQDSYKNLRITRHDVEIAKWEAIA